MPEARSKEVWVVLEVVLVVLEVVLVVLEVVPEGPSERPSRRLSGGSIFLTIFRTPWALP